MIIKKKTIVFEVTEIEKGEKVFVLSIKDDPNNIGEVAIKDLLVNNYGMENDFNVVKI